MLNYLWQNHRVGTLVAMLIVLGMMFATALLAAHWQKGVTQEKEREHMRREMKAAQARCDREKGTVETAMKIRCNDLLLREYEKQARMANVQNKRLEKGRGWRLHIEIPPLVNSDIAVLYACVAEKNKPSVRWCAGMYRYY